MFYKQSCIFAEFPLDPCDEIRGNENEIRSLLNEPATRFVLFQNGNALMDTENVGQPLYQQRENCEEDFVFLGKDPSRAYFACEKTDDCEIKHGVFVDLRTIAREVAAIGFSPVPSLLARGKMLLDWHSRHQFCANCGAKSISMKGGYVRHCGICDTDHFPRVDPVVIMMVIFENKCLLGRSASFLPGMYSALAGFMEPGETIEEAVRREVFEEAGIRVGDVEYIKSQPWPFPSSLMIGVIAQALNDDLNIENDELEDAKWFTKDEIKTVLGNGGDDEFRVPEKLAIARHLLEYHLMLRWTND